MDDTGGTEQHMRILYLHRTRGEGVEGVHIRGMIQGFRQGGHQVDVLSPLGWVRDGEKARKQGRREPRWNIFRFVSRYMPETLFELLEILYNINIFWMLRGCSPGSYDLIYERYSLFGIAGTVVAGRLGMPIILEINYLVSSPLARRRTRLLGSLARRMERYLLRKATAFAAVSSSLVRELVSAGVPETRIGMIPNAVDPTVFDPSLHDGRSGRNRLGIGERATVIGFVGGFYPWHGVPAFIESLVPLLKSREDLSLLLVGEGPERKKAEETARRRGVFRKVHFTGSVPHFELPAILSCMDIGVMPNSNHYGSPMKVFEYMAMEISVVAPRLPPLEDVIREGRNGFLFMSGKERELLEKIDLLLYDSDMRKEIGRTARRDVVKVHNWRANAEKALHLLAPDGEEILHERVISGRRLFDSGI